MKILLFSCLTTIFLLAGCSASGQKFQGFETQDPSTAEIYIYRPSKLISIVEAPAIFINDEIQDQLKNGGFLKYKLLPGEHKLKLGNDENAIFTAWSYPDIEWTARLSPNTKYFYRLDIEFGGILPLGEIAAIARSIRVVEIPKETASEELLELSSSM